MNTKYYTDYQNPEGEDCGMLMHEKLDRLKRNMQNDHPYIFSDVIYTLLSDKRVHVSESTIFEVDDVTVTADFLNIYQIKWMLKEDKSVVIYSVHYDTAQDTLRGFIF